MSNVMDIEIKGRRPGRRAAIALLIGVCATGALAGLRTLHHLPVAERTVDRTTIVVDHVTSGPLVREIRADGTLVSDRIRVVSAPADGFVESISVRPGTAVQPGMIVTQLSNPQLHADLAAIRAQIAAARADVDNERAQAITAHIDALGAYAVVKSQHGEAAIEAAVDDDLHRHGFLADLPNRVAHLKLSDLADQLRLVASRVPAADAGERAKIAAARAKLAQLKGLEIAKRAEIMLLTVRAEITGVVQAIPIEAGMRVSAGALIARIADMTSLKAVLNVPDTAARDVVVGQSVILSLASGSVSGRITHINPSAINGTIAVEAIPLRLPAGTRPDGAIEGTIAVERLATALSLARPAGVVDAGTIDLFKLTPDRTRALRVRVGVARGSDARVRITSGLAAGDDVIVSDLSPFEGIDHFGLHG